MEKIRSKIIIPSVFGSIEMQLRGQFEKTKTSKHKHIKLRVKQLGQFLRRLNYNEIVANKTESTIKY